jgi:hypothetical protein
LFHGGEVVRLFAERHSELVAQLDDLARRVEDMRTLRASRWCAAQQIIERLRCP